jgi:hypothetical protein
MANQITPKNYIYFRGGSFGDITGKIVNNGKVLDKRLQTVIKSNLKIDPKFIERCNIETIVGHNKAILNYGLKNFQIIIPDERVRSIAARRFAEVNEIYNLAMTLIRYYPKEMHKTIRSLPLDKQISLLEKHYNIDIVDVPTIKLDFSCILDKDKFLDLLGEHFEFDRSIASEIWDEWYQKNLKYFE